jgi:hypothetical protein
MNKLRPILFSTPMVRAILEGRKTQTRRAIVPQPKPINGDCSIVCRYGQAGDGLWVRERWGYLQQFQDRSAADGGPVVYAADAESSRFTGRAWRQSRHMPKLASRITLQVIAIRMQRLQQISKEDARAEGFDPGCGFADPIQWFHHLWDPLNADRGYGWLENPWVWAISFTVASVARK